MLPVIIVLSSVLIAMPPAESLRPWCTFGSADVSSTCCSCRSAQVSVEDVSNKSSMLMRLLYVAAHMRTWYGKWGYGFGRSAFNHSREEYDRAMRAVHNAPLAGLLRDLEVRRDAVTGT